MKRDVKVSVLVPIYNVEAFLSECLDSLINQTLEEIEIICINDGSTDSSLEIVKEFKKHDSRIVIVDKKNSGYGDSMNQGLKKASGEYVGIVESDDFIDRDAFRVLYGIAKKYDLDVVKANFYEYYTDKRCDVAKSNMFLPEEEGVVLSPKEHRHIFYEQPSIWSGLYRRSFLNKNNIWFLPTPGASYQDAGFNFKVWATADRVMMLNSAFLHYRQDNPNSSVKSEGKVNAVKDEYDAVEEYLEEHGLLDDFGGTLVGMRFSSYIWNMRRLTRAAAKQFAKTIKMDYSRLNAEGIIDEEKMDVVARENAKNIAICHPNLYIYLRPGIELYHSSLRGLSRISKKISPMRRQQAHTEELLNQLDIVREEIDRKMDAITRKDDNES